MLVHAVGARLRRRVLSLGGGGGALHPFKGRDRRKEARLLDKIGERMRTNVEDHCATKMCAVETGGYRSTCVPYFDEEGRVNLCPAGFAERPMDENGRKYAVPPCSSAKSCAADIRADGLHSSRVNEIAQMHETDVNRGISRAECEAKGCLYKANSTLRCVEKDSGLACNNCLIQNVEQENAVQREVRSDAQGFTKKPVLLSK